MIVLVPIQNRSEPFQFLTVALHHNPRGLAIRIPNVWLGGRVEIGVAFAIGLGCALDELTAIYRGQLPVMRQYIADTDYDANHRDVLTVSVSFLGIGLPRNALGGDDCTSIYPPSRKVSDIAFGWEKGRTLETAIIRRRFSDYGQPDDSTQRELMWTATSALCKRGKNCATIRSRLESSGR